METVLLLIIISMIVSIGFLIAFIRAVSKGQFEDLQSPSVRILFEDNNVKLSNKLLDEN
ncbi:MAG: Cytochrome oxidase maturation protein cbb3-type [Ignavibacteria bacterium]|nr:Cytochrome oxidase maturation protein cbb3-type [Ignavibacteria bacterium]